MTNQKSHRNNISMLNWVKCLFYRLSTISDELFLQNKLTLSYLEGSSRIPLRVRDLWINLLQMKMQNKANLNKRLIKRVAPSSDLLRRSVAKMEACGWKYKTKPNYCVSNQISKVHLKNKPILKLQSMQSVKSVVPSFMQNKPKSNPFCSLVAGLVSLDYLQNKANLPTPLVIFVSSRYNVSLV